MKKFVAMLLALAMCFSLLTACGDKGPQLLPGKFRCQFPGRNRLFFVD